MVDLPDHDSVLKWLNDIIKLPLKAKIIRLIILVVFMLGSFFAGKESSTIKIASDNKQYEVNNPTITIDSRKYVNLIVQNWTVTNGNEFVGKATAKDVATGDSVKLSVSGKINYMYDGAGNKMYDDAGNPMIAK